MLSRLIRLFKSFSRKEQALFLAALAVFVVSGITVSITTFYQSTTPTPIEGGAYIEGIVGQPIAVNPLIVGDNDADRDLIALLFTGLLDLAESYQTDADQKVWTINLKPDLQWSDGHPLTSSDVIFTIGIIQDPDTRSPQFTTWQGVVAERVSEREVRLILKNQYAFFLENLKNLRIAPQHVFDNIPPQNYRLSEFNLKPVGSGAYKFVRLEKQPNGFITNYALTANKNSAVGEPFIQDWEVKFFPGKADAIKALNAREIDGIGGLDSADLESVKIHHQVIETNRPRYYAIFFNQGLSLPLKEKAVRTALNEATNKEMLVKDVLGGRGFAVSGPIPPNVTGYDSSVFTNEISSAAASSSTLDKAGWNPEDDGIRSKVVQKVKARLEFDLIVPDVKFLVDTANALKESWKKVGIGLNTVVLKPSEVVSAAIRPRNYQMILFGNTLNNNPDIFSFWHSSQRFDPGLNLSLFNSKTVDGLLESVRQNINEATRQADLTKLQKLITDEKPAVFLYSPNYLYVTAKNLGGFSAEAITVPADRFYKVNEWFLKTARIFK